VDGITPIKCGRGPDGKGRFAGAGVEETQRFQRRKDRKEEKTKVGQREARRVAARAFNALVIVPPYPALSPLLCVLCVFETFAFPQPPNAKLTSPVRKTVELASASFLTLPLRRQ
jgi:hypothetical protein